MHIRAMFPSVILDNVSERQGPYGTLLLICEVQIVNLTVLKMGK